MAKVWKDGEAGGTPITAAELNRIETTLEAKAARGERGPAGPEGPAGPKGDTGPAGPAGADADLTQVNEQIAALEARIAALEEAAV